MKKALFGLALVTVLAACSQQVSESGSKTPGGQTVSAQEAILSDYPWVQGTTYTDGSAFTSSGSPVLASREESSNSIWVRQFSAGQWQGYGGRIAIQTAKFVSGNPISPLLALTSTDVPVIAYLDGSTTRARIWNSGSWFTYPADWGKGTSVQAPLGLAVDGAQQNRPALLLGDYNSSGLLTKLQVYMLIGGRMKAVFGPAVTASMNPTTYSFMRLDSGGVPVVAWTQSAGLGGLPTSIVLQKPEPQGALLAVAIQNPQNYTWTWKTIGTIPSSVGILQMSGLDMTYDNQPLVAWRTSDFSGAGTAYVSRLDSSGFVTLGGGPVRARGLQTSIQTKVTTDGTLYALLTNGGYRQPVGVDGAKFDATAWSYKTDLLTSWTSPYTLSLLKDSQNDIFVVYQLPNSGGVAGTLIKQFSIP